MGTKLLALMVYLVSGLFKTSQKSVTTDTCLLTCQHIVGVTNKINDRPIKHLKASFSYTEYNTDVLFY